jgi:uncharacterized metal-binding protein YceD (DUF177 family)
MITFKISDIAMGKSEREINFSSEDVAIEEVPFEEGYLELDFERLHDSIKVIFFVGGIARLTCDRSLEVFDYPISRSYTVLFRVDQVVDVEDEFTAARKLDLNKNKLDLTEMVRETILLEVPIKKLHPRFLDKDGNPTQFEIDYGGDEQLGGEDSRWDALKKIQQPKTDS